MKNSNLCYTHLVNVYLDINVVCVHSPGVLSECTGCERVNMHVIALMDVIVIVYRGKCAGKHIFHSKEVFLLSLKLFLCLFIKGVRLGSGL